VSEVGVAELTVVVDDILAFGRVEVDTGQASHLHGR